MFTLFFFNSRYSVCVSNIWFINTSIWSEFVNQPSLSNANRLLGNDCYTVYTLFIVLLVLQTNLAYYLHTVRRRNWFEEGFSTSICLVIAVGSSYLEIGFYGYLCIKNHKHLILVKSSENTLNQSK